MGEMYARVIVYRALMPGMQRRPHMSFDTLREAVPYADQLIADGQDVQVIDLEHLHLGDMLNAPDAANLIAGIRASVVAEGPRN
jgi:hypothetical protein